MTGRNCALYAPRAIESVAKQTLKDVHILFIDDARMTITGEAPGISGDHFADRHTLVVNETRFGKGHGMLRSISAACW